MIVTCGCTGSPALDGRYRCRARRSFNAGSEQWERALRHASRIAAGTPSRSRDHVVQQQSRARRKARKIRYHDHEWNEIAAQARACGIPAATFIRRVSLGAKPRARRNRNENELILRLGSIATDLDSLAHAYHQTDRPLDTARLRLVLDEVLATIRRIG